MGQTSITGHQRGQEPRGLRARQGSTPAIAAPDLGSAANPVEGEIEDVEVAQWAGFGEPLIFWIKPPRQNKRYALLAEAAMGAQTVAGKPREVVLGARCADYGVGVA